MRKEHSKMVTVLGIIGVAIIGLLGWVLNMGFNRFVFTILGIPFFMLLAIVIIDLIAAKYYKRSRLLMAGNIFFNLSYICTHVLLPDGMMNPPVDEGTGSGSYMLFGLIHNSDLYDTFMAITLFFFACFVITLIFQIVCIIVLKHRIKKNQRAMATTDGAAS